jgi:hypothetical protein
VINAGGRKRYRVAGATETKQTQSPVNHEKTVTEIATDLTSRNMLGNSKMLTRNTLEVGNTQILVCFLFDNQPALQ